MPSKKKLVIGENGAAQADLPDGAAHLPTTDAPLALTGDDSASQPVDAPLALTGDDAASQPVRERVWRDSPQLPTSDAPPDAPPAEDEVLQIWAQAFLKKYYDMFNTNQKKVHTLYSENGYLYLAIHKIEVSAVLKTAKAIKEFWDYFQEPLMSCRAHWFVAQQKQDVTLITVNGKSSGFGRHTTNFVESFVLNKDGYIINDVLLVFRDGKPIQLPRGLKQKQEQFLSAKNSTLLRRSARIEQNKTQGSCKVSKAEVQPSIKTESKSARGFIIREPSLHKGPEAEVELPTRIQSKCARDLIIREPTLRKDVDITCAEPREATSVAILYDDTMLGHTPEFYCSIDDPQVRMMKQKSKKNIWDTPERIRCIIDRLTEENLFDRAVHVGHNPATQDDVLAVHKAEYVNFIDKLPLSLEELDKYIGYYTNDMFCSVGTREAIYSAAGATMKACDVVIKDQFKTAFAIVRPPGHHAGEDEAEGFCYVNNIAVALVHLRRVYGIKKKLVVDWDAHHGNGTEKLFYATDEVLFFNIFNVELHYPLTSELHAERIGRGKGGGHNVNVPLASGFGDGDMLYIWENLLLPLIKAYSPNIILISCGLDAASGDPLGFAEVTAPCYATLFKMIENVGNGRVVLSLEGGYNLKVMAECASHIVRAMVGDREALLPESKERDAHPLPSTVRTVKQLKRNLCRFWDVFKTKPQRRKH